MIFVSDDKSLDTSPESALIVFHCRELVSAFDSSESGATSPIDDSGMYTIVAELVYESNLLATYKSSDVGSLEDASSNPYSSKHLQVTPPCHCSPSLPRSVH